MGMPLLRRRRLLLLNLLLLLEVVQDEGAAMLALGCGVLLQGCEVPVQQKRQP